jgi:hypothetical protein
VAALERSLARAEQKASAMRESVEVYRTEHARTHDSLWADRFRILKELADLRVAAQLSESNLAHARQSLSDLTEESARERSRGEAQLAHLEALIAEAIERIDGVRARSAKDIKDHALEILDDLLTSLPALLQRRARPAAER